MVEIEDVRRIMGVSPYRQQSLFARLYDWVCIPPRPFIVVTATCGAFWAGVVEGIIHQAGVYRLVLGAYNDIAGNLGDAWHIGDGIGWLSPMKWGLATAAGMTVFCLVMLAIRRVQTGKWGSDDE